MLMPCTLRNETGLLAALQVAEYSELYRNEAGVWLIARIEVRVRRLSIENGAWIDLSGALGDYPAAVDVANLG